MLGQDDEECRSPVSCVNSVFDSADQLFSSPNTSPSCSPVKSAKPTTSQDYTIVSLYDGSPAGLHEALSGTPLLEHDSVPEPDSSSDVQEPIATPTNKRIVQAWLEDHSARPRRSIRQSFSQRPSARVCGIDKPDRFMPARYATPTKQALLLSTPTTLSSASTSNSDPFLPVTRSRSRIANQYAVLRSPARPIFPAGLHTNLLRRGGGIASAGPGSIPATWTANRHPVTEGMISITDSHGGRITSGSNAPHFCADLLYMTEQDQCLGLHEQRLAVAMEIDQTTRLIQPGAMILRSKHVPADTHKQMAAWRDSHWQWSRPFHDKDHSTSPKQVSSIPYRVLDAPTLRDDFYCSLLAYCPALDCLAVGLAHHIYIWSEKGRRSDNLPESLVSQLSFSHVTSLSFSSPGQARSILAIGRSDGLLSLWHPLDKEPRLIKHHSTPISFVSFRPFATRRPSMRNEHIIVETEELLVGDDLGKVVLYSVEWPCPTQRDLFDWEGCITQRAVITCHNQQICGIAWSADGEQFATGANDNRLSVFSYKDVNRAPRLSDVSHHQGHTQRFWTRSEPDYSTITFGDEKKSFSLNAAVKAIAFAPWQPDLLAARGGSNDRCVHFFHIRSGARLATINCHAQVTSVIWNTQRREVAVTLGFAQPKHSFRVAVFAWPSCDLLVSIPWLSEERALYAIPFPGGPAGRRDPRRQTLVIATSDASIKFHEVWPQRKVQERQTLVDLDSHILNDTCSVKLQNEGMIR